MTIHVGQRDCLIHCLLFGSKDTEGLQYTFPQVSLASIWGSFPSIYGQREWSDSD